MVAGSFTMAGDIACSRLAQWDGHSWRPLGAGTNGPVYALEVFGSGLVAFGDFTTAGGIAANHIAVLVEQD